MRKAVIVSTARTPIAKAYRGSYNNLTVPSLMAFSMNEAIKRAKIDASEIEDITIGCALTQGSAGVNVARHAAMAANIPVSVAASTVDRQCASGLNAIAIAANQVVNEGYDIVLAGGVESCSLVQNETWNASNYEDALVKSEYYMPMLQTAELVASRYNVTREEQDKYALQSQQRTFQAQEKGYFDSEIIPVTAIMNVKDKYSGEVTQKEVTIVKDECNRKETTFTTLSNLTPVLGAHTSITAGNASQLSDGSSSCVIMEEKEAIKRNLIPLGTYLGMSVAGCEPEEMGIGPVVAIPKLLKRFNLTVEDIGLWEINEAFASQLLYCKNTLGISDDRLNVNGGSISIGHPYGMSGARMSGHALIEGKRRGVKYAVVSMCVGGGQGVAALFEINNS
ncbi:MAG: acetyl-CoA C-acyltransferase [Sulfurospirillaceae bacterium]|nr:acetyl-CoA C-acyltransferase [Sulfurospirillaceae bacterium]